MSLIKQLVTTLPFYSVPNSYVGATSLQTPFYFQKEQCLQDCFFGTITDREHLPAFIVRAPTGLDINCTTPYEFNILCADGSNSIAIVPVYRWTVIARINAAEKAALALIPPVIGSMYYFDNADGTDIEILTWTVSGWASTGQIVPVENDLLNVISENIVYCWSPDPDSVDPNPARQGSWLQTNNGFQLCDIGDETYFIYNGFKVEQLPCGLQQLQIKFSNLPDTPSTPIWMSELVDVKDFNILNNKYHKLKIHNDCNLGNIPYGSIKFDQIYYFNEDTLIGEPKYEIEQDKEEDGLGQERLIFTKTTKSFLLDTKLVPEYIVDFFAFAGMHDLITMTFPQETTNVLTFTSQYKGEREIDKDNYTVTPDWIDSACYATVKLLFGLLEDIIDTSCCQTLDKDGCLVCSFNTIALVDAGQQAETENIPPQTGDCWLILTGAPVPDLDTWPSHIGEIACWNGTGWDYTPATEDLLICNAEDSKQYIYDPIDGWIEFLSNVTLAATASTITIKGYIPTGAIASVYYRDSSQVTWTLFSTYSEADIRVGQTITGLISEENYDIRLLVKTNNCSYGYGRINNTQAIAII